MPSPSSVVFKFHSAFFRVIWGLSTYCTAHPPVSDSASGPEAGAAGWRPHLKNHEPRQSCSILDLTLVSRGGPGKCTPLTLPTTGQWSRSLWEGGLGTGHGEAPQLFLLCSRDKSFWPRERDGRNKRRPRPKTLGHQPFKWWVDKETEKWRDKGSAMEGSY